jgi:hypothetical protein
MIKCTMLYDPAAFSSVSILFYYIMLRPWHLISNLEKNGSSSYRGDEEYQGVWSCGLWLCLCLALARFFNYVMLTLTFDLWHWRKGLFLSVLLSRVPSCMLLRLTIRSPPCPNDFSTILYDNLDFWPWKMIGFFPLSWWVSVPSCIILRVRIQSLSCHKKCFYYAMLQSWHLTSDLQKQ